MGARSLCKLRDIIGQCCYLVRDISCLIGKILLGLWVTIIRGLATGRSDVKDMTF